MRPLPWRRTALASLAAAGAALMPLNAAGVERWYSTGWYQALQPALTGATGVVPIAVLDVWIVLAAIGCGWALWRVARTPRGARGRMTIAVSLNLVTAASLVYLAFLICWGLNYRRQPITAGLQFDKARVTEAAVESAAAQAVTSLARLHEPAHAELKTLASLASLRVALAPAFGNAQRALGREPFARAGRAKTSIISPFLRWATVDGLINPLGLEVIVNPDVLPVERPFVLAHEWGHLAGWARESEASYVGWLTCRDAGPAAQYSGWLSLYWHLRRDLARDRVAAYDRRLGPGPRRDLSAIAARLARGQPVIQQASWRTYDQFLKANRVDSGIKNYDEVVTLVVGTRTDVDRHPTLR